MGRLRRRVRAHQYGQGAQKDRNLRANPHVAISVLDPDNPYRYLGLQGEVVEVTEEGALTTFINWRRNIGDGPTTLGEGEVRALYKIKRRGCGRRIEGGDA
ncbi:MAG: pyridoxamine 5'-phosphate oxidase family protein [Caldilineaceae bacterium]